MTRIFAAATLLAMSSGALSAETFQADVWADNWFEMRINGETVAEDSVPASTERSFNAESFSFDADRPFVIGVVAMDYRQDDTGLEYIGTDRQQMGDGAQVAKESAGRGLGAWVLGASLRGKPPGQTSFVKDLLLPN